MRWRLIRTPPRSGAENMAIDQALFESVQVGEAPCLRFYAWSPAALSLGRNQPVGSAQSVARAAAARGLDVVRRPTGGAAVLHDRELTYAVVAPVGALGSPRESYVAINRALVAGLRRLGVEAAVAGEGGGASAATWDGPCFRAAAPGEVVVAGRKLVGSAQRCERRTLLQHGSLLLDGGQQVVADLLGSVRGEVAPAEAPFVTLAEVRRRIPDPESLVSCLCDGFEEALGIRLAPAALSDAESARAAVLAEHFRSREWTWRR